MTAPEVALAQQPFPTPDRVGQGTAIEQSRAVAQVQAAVVVARQFPRSLQAAVRAMNEACSLPSLADRAFYDVPRGGKRAKGASIHLARELARIFGNIDYGVAELRRDDEFGQSEMQAWAWDLETNTRVSTGFIVPHTRDVGGATRPLKLSQEIYENNANAAGRRVRECIRSVLPKWFLEDAEARCWTTINNPTDEKNRPIPLPKRIARLVQLYEEMGIDLPRLEAKLGKPSRDWTAWDASQLYVTGKSLERGELSMDEAFPQQTVSPQEIAAHAAAAAAAPNTLPERVVELLVQVGVNDPADIAEVLTVITGREIKPGSRLKPAESTTVTQLLERCAGTPNPPDALEQALAEITAGRTE